MLKYLLLWFPMLLIAILNGLLRESFVKKYTNEITAHQLSTVTLILFFGIYIGFVIKLWRPSSTTQTILIGIIWLALTLAFEFGFGRWRGNSWNQLFSEYNIARGKLWVLIPLWVAFAPLLFYKLLKQ